MCEAAAKPCYGGTAFQGAFASIFFFPVTNLIARPSATFALGHWHGIGMKI